MFLKDFGSFRREDARNETWLEVPSWLRARILFPTTSTQQRDPPSDLLNAVGVLVGRK
jgi:hypothetical protein